MSDKVEFLAVTAEVSYRGNRFLVSAEATMNGTWTTGMVKPWENDIGDTGELKAAVEAKLNAPDCDAVNEAHRKILRVAYELLNGTDLPSEYIEDHKQKTYSAGRLAAMSAKWRERNRCRAVALREASDDLRKALNGGKL